MQVVNLIISTSYRLNRMQLTDIKGVGKVTQEKLNQLGIISFEDLLLYLPAKYYDLSKVTLINNVKPGEYVLIKGCLLNPIKVQYIRRNFQVIRNYIADDTGVIEVEWFNQPYLSNILKKNSEFYFFGKITIKDNKRKFINPSIDDINNTKRYKGILPIYRTKNVINQTNFYSYIKNALEKPFFKENIVDKMTDITLSEAYKLIHTPETLDDAKKGNERVALEKIIKAIFAYNLVNKEDNIKKDFTLDEILLKTYLSSLPFKLTDSQNCALNEIIESMQSNKRMNRMLVGDVGSGKTIISFIISLLMINCGFQVALMAPTEILANQHFINAMKFLNGFVKDDEITLLTSSTKNKKKIIDLINNGEIKLVIGTHSVLQDSVKFNNLKLIIVDEVHKFGVKQKAALERKMENIDILTMSATPIPRTISLMFAGELQISTIEKREENLSNVRTKVVDASLKNNLMKYLLEQTQKGEKVYLVCPRIEAPDGDEIDSIQSIYTALLDNGFNVSQIGYIHGKIKAEERNLLLEQFKDNKINIIISTTVIEVGIDIKDVNIMVIFDADYFGLATLHQLRGRIGRDGSSAICYLVSTDKENKRLEAMQTSNNGFELANIDAQLRGYGDFFGYNQSGTNAYPFVIDEKLIKNARQIIDSLSEDDKQILKNDPTILNYQIKLQDVTLN